MTEYPRVTLYKGGDATSIYQNPDGTYYTILWENPLENEKWDKSTKSESVDGLEMAEQLKILLHGGWHL